MLKQYECIYIEPAGLERKALVLASDPKEVIKRFKEQGFVVIEIREKEKKEVSFALQKAITRQDLYNIANQLSVLLRSGMKIDQALTLLISTSKKQKLKEILTSINHELKAGQSIAKAIEKNKLFPSVCISMIYVGETIGNLWTAFDNVAQYLKFQIELKREIINSLTYPIFLIFSSIVTLIFMFNFIIPRFFAIFETTGTMPLPARFIFALARIFNIKYLIVVLVVIFIFLLLKKYKLIKFNLEKSAWIIGKLPFVKTLLFHLELSRFCYSMHSMLKSGVEFINAVKLSADIIQDKALKDSFLSSINEIKKGKRISEVYSQMAILPEIFSNLIVVGDESGNLSEVFYELYHVFNDRFKTLIRRFLTLLEPAIIVFMGLIVGFIVISLIITVMNVGAIKF
jgi:general secretion pathway protein F